MKSFGAARWSVNHDCAAASPSLSAPAFLFGGAFDAACAWLKLANTARAAAAARKRRRGIGTTPKKPADGSHTPPGGNLVFRIYSTFCQIRCGGRRPTTRHSWTREGPPAPRGGHH